MTPLPTDQRTRLENAVAEARVAAEKGARQALEALAVDRSAPHGSMTPEDRALRNRLRAHGRQLGDIPDRTGSQTVERLVREVAYEQWHRMLFARFLAENHLLIEPTSKVAVTLDECEELARERGEEPWALAASFAQGMLPRIFRTADPALQVTLPPETRQALQRLLSALPGVVFTQDDSLGWTYQFWQAAEKDAVNARVKSGEKVSGEALPAVTQLFTEPYMVHFLLHNTIGAWHAGKVLSDLALDGAASEQVLRDAVRLAPEGGYDFEYLRFVREPSGEGDAAAGTGRWRPAAGTFSGWPRTARELRVLDPCCGSGHFLVAAFELLVRLRMQEEGLDVRSAARAVIRENLFGLELDPRCTQIAAFNLALAAWKVAGAPIELPSLRIACSGIGPRASKKEWLHLAEEAAAAGGMPGARDLFGSEETLLSAGVRDGLEALYDLFEKAPDLGSLIDPKATRDGAPQLDALQADFAALEPLLDAILQREGTDEEEVERAVAAKGMAEAARILVGPKGGYTLVITNVPYLGRSAHTDAFKEWADSHYKEAKNDLATIFVARMLRWVGGGGEAGTVAAVTPQNWLFLGSYGRLRRRLLKTTQWHLTVFLGSNAFQVMNWWAATTALIAMSASGRHPRKSFVGFNAGADKKIASKVAFLAGGAHVAITAQDGFGSDSMIGPLLLEQEAQLENPDARIVINPSVRGALLSEVAESHHGLTTGDTERMALSFWELRVAGPEWTHFRGSTDSTRPFGGCEGILRWEEGSGAINELPGARKDGQGAWGMGGVIVRQMRHLPASIYLGEPFDNNTAVIVPKKRDHLPAVWSFVESSEFLRAVRDVDQKLSVTSATLVKVPFDLAHWQEVADEKYPNGLPEPYSDDPTQWLFHGHPAHAESGTELHIAVARLLGYRWPAELDPEMRLAAEARALIERCRDLDTHGFSDADGIVCLSPVRGESSAADRVRSLLAAAYGSAWSAAKERDLLAATAGAAHGTGRRADTLDEWLRGAFFEEHCKLFHHRPFVWHVWDGLTHGFNALVNYHRLAGPDSLGRRTLESLTFAYLGEWIERQRSARDSGQEGADARLAAALRLQEELQKIREGEPPYDLFVRWKPIHEQPLGWEPDLNDGVRLNIRAFLFAEDVGRRGAGILRWAPNVKWSKDRGKEPEGLRPPSIFPWFWGCDPDKNPAHRIDFGTGRPGTSPAGADFTGIRWNGLHYTRAAKEAARARAPSEEGKR